MTGAGYDKLSKKFINGFNILPIEASQELTLLGQSEVVMDANFERQRASPIASAQRWGPNLKIAYGRMDQRMPHIYRSVFSIYSGKIL